VPSWYLIDHSNSPAFSILYLNRILNILCTHKQTQEPAQRKKAYACRQNQNLPFQSGVAILDPFLGCITVPVQFRQRSRSHSRTFQSRRTTWYRLAKLKFSYVEQVTELFEPVVSSTIMLSQSSPFAKPFTAPAAPSPPAFRCSPHRPACRHAADKKMEVPLREASDYSAVRLFQGLKTLSPALG